MARESVSAFGPQWRKWEDLNEEEIAMGVDAFAN